MENVFLFWEGVMVWFVGVAEVERVWELDRVLRETP